MDILDVVDVYMQRPVAVAHIGLGDWFCRACGIVQRDLIYSTTKEAKRIINEQHIPFERDLAVTLRNFNKQHEEK